jgi:hypothetical protein
MSDHDNYMQDLSDSHASRHDGGSIAVVLANPSSCAKRKEKGNGKKGRGGEEVEDWRVWRDSPTAKSRGRGRGRGESMTHELATAGGARTLGPPAPSSLYLSPPRSRSP